MAGPLLCDNHPDRVAAVLMTNLDGSGSLTVCQPCFLQFCLDVVQSLQEIPEITQEELEADEEAADLEGESPAPDASPKSEPEPATPPAPTKRRRPAPAQETETPGE